MVNSIPAINSLDFYTVHKILASSNISENKKEQFIRQNKIEIKNILEANISGNEYKFIMNCRPLQKFKPIKNSFTKMGDKILLAKTLGIELSELDDYINNVQNDLSDIDKLNFLSKDKIEAIKTYIYRHGSKEGIQVFLDYELKNAKDILETLYRTLEYHTGGLADYFIRPVHRMSNLTMVKLYNVINKNIESAQKNGLISDEEANKAAKWALIRIYQIQNNSKLINAVKTYNTLKY